MAQQQQQQRPRGTAVTTRQAEAARLDLIRGAMLGKASELTIALANTIEPTKFVEIALTMIASIKEPETRAKVLDCTPESLALAVVQCAQLGLRMDGQHATVVPYAGVAQFTPMVRGRIALINRAPGIAGVVTRAVYDCDQFDVLMGTTEEIVHRPNLDRPQDAKLTHAYAVVRFLDGRPPVFEVVTRARIDQIREQFSKAKDSPAWKKSFAEMAQKVALNRIERLIDTDPDHARILRAAVEAEFTLPTEPDDGEAVTARVRDQVADARAKIEQLRPQAGGAFQKPAAAPTREQLLEQIRQESIRQDLTEEQASQEATHALVGVDCARDGRGIPVPDRLTVEQLQGVLEHFRGLGPGFGGDGGSGGAPAAPEGAQDAPQAAAGAPDPRETAPGPAPSSGGNPDAGKVDLVGYRRVGQGAGSVHLIDPRVRTDKENPPVCIGCGKKVGGQQGGAGFVASQLTPRDTFCARALELVATYPEERVPSVLVALLVQEPTP